MPVIIRAQEPLRKLFENQSALELAPSPDTIANAIEALESRFIGVKDRLLNEHGGIRRSVNIYVNEENIRFLQDQQTPLKDGDEVSIVPASAGG